jgi:opacity protein-like surface antigen
MRTQHRAKWAPAVLVAVLSIFAATLAPLEASAQQVDDEIEIDDSYDRNEYMLTPRVRAIVVPDWVMGMWFEEHASHWDGQANMAYGLDFVWRKVGDFEISTAVEYADLSMPDAFWQEQGDEPRESDFTEVDLQLLSLVFSGYWYWDVEQWFAPYVGGGIGLGVPLGDIVKYEPIEGGDCHSNLGQSSGFAPNSCFNDNGDPNPDAIDLDNPDVEDGVPVVVPMLNLTGGMRFNIGDHGVAKLEVGFYNYFFAGLSLGGQW